jgi:hypothetical protein
MSRIERRRHALRIEREPERPRERLHARVLDEEAEVVVDEAVREPARWGSSATQRDPPRG